jgi:ATP-dependent exoDNAse (exonuclease V) beta subunit
MILASAGSGKTYALTNRFVRLLALGVSPERIVALTFTRKAAGEFFDEILVKLARAARDSTQAARLATAIGEPELETSDFRRLLRLVVEAMPRLRLGTFDGFFSRIARTFPFELGLTGQFEILQEHSASLERTRVLRRMFEHTRAVQPAQREFIEAFKRATFGADEKRLQSQLDGFLDRHQEVFLNARDESAWGDRTRIWPQGAEWENAAAKRSEAQRALSDAVARIDLNDAQRERWRAFFEELNEWSPGAVLGDGLGYLLKNAFKALPDLNEIVVHRKKVPLDSETRRSLRQLLHAVIELEMMRRLEMTKGIRDVLSSYERIYHDVVRRAGKLTFGDIQRLLQPRDDAPVWSPEDSESGRHVLDYRLDGEIDHWLLDEFQDTSFGQWNVLKNLIDEVVQDPTGMRSFFYVGDVKQAIFSWRDGDPRLFREIFNRYNAIQEGTIAEEHLVESWRSGPAIIETVNRVFGDAAVLSEMFPGPAADTWNCEWLNHRSAKPGLVGQAALLHARDESERFNVALEVLQEIAPLERGLSCALLVQDNATGARLADYLRREGGMPAVAESDLHVCTDNPLGTALLSLVKAAAHPGDSLAREHLRMTPIGTLLDGQFLATPDRLSLFVLGQIHARGFEPAMAYWIQRLQPAWAKDDPFTRERARQFIAAAGEFDSTGSRDAGEFIAFMERYTLRDVEISGALRVMTIHKSKGLGFDVVILADLDGNRLDCRRFGLAVEKNADRDVQWVLDLPEKLFHTHDPVLAAHVRRAEADACY